MEDRTLKDSTPPPPKGKLETEAFERGKKARLQGRQRSECPFGDYPGRIFRRMWLAGWESVTPPEPRDELPPGTPRLNLLP